MTKFWAWNYKKNCNIWVRSSRENKHKLPNLTLRIPRMINAVRLRVSTSLLLVARASTCKDLLLSLCSQYLATKMNIVRDMHNSWILKNIVQSLFSKNKNFVWDLDSSLHKRSVHLACSELNEWTMSGLACPSNILDLARSDMPPIRQISGNYHSQTDSTTAY